MTSDMRDADPGMPKKIVVPKGGQKNMVVSVEQVAAQQKGYEARIRRQREALDRVLEAKAMVEAQLLIATGLLGDVTVGGEQWDRVTRAEAIIQASNSADMVGRLASEVDMYQKANDNLRKLNEDLTALAHVADDEPAHLRALTRAGLVSMTKSAIEAADNAMSQVTPLQEQLVGMKGDYDRLLAEHTRLIAEFAAGESTTESGTTTVVWDRRVPAEEAADPAEVDPGTGIHPIRRPVPNVPVDPPQKAVGVTFMTPDGEVGGWVTTEDGAHHPLPDGGARPGSF